MTFRLFAFSLGFALLTLSGVAATARAEDPIAPAAQPQPPPAQPPGEPAPPPPGYATNPPPAAYGTPPPPQQGPMQPGSQVVVVEQGGYGAYGYAQQPYGYADPRELQYGHARKHVWLAILFDAILPGLGNIYAGEILYSIVTWAGLIAGMTLMFNSIEGSYDSSTGTYEDSDDNLLGIGVLLFIGSYVFGIVTAGLNTAAYNAELRTQLGLQASLAPTPDFAGATLSLGTRF